jgi:hypothetical protein
MSGLRFDRLGALFVVTVVLILDRAQAQAPSGEAKMKQGLQLPACLVCHSSDKDRGKLADLNRSCDTNCRRCHQEMEKHHPVGGGVEEKDKMTLPLSTGDKVACITCHDPGARRTDTRSWKSQSLFSRLFRSQTVYKTYYLRINNADGNLCRACH